jgi:hypothetical protein
MATLHQENNMRKLSAIDIKLKLDLEIRLEEVADKIRLHTNLFNELIGTIVKLQDEFNSIAQEANTWREAVSDNMVSYMDERSAAWHSGDNGCAYQEWASTWQEEFECLELDIANPMDIPEFLAIDSIGELTEAS